MQIRCPHCRHPVEVVDEKLLEEVVCPSCGSNISLVSEETTIAHGSAASRHLAHFELLNSIGVGAFGMVWKARDTILDRIVALKVPRRGQLEATETEYFLRDARAAAQLRHPNIVSVHEVGRDGGTVFIASDFIDGADLRAWLTAQPLTIREAAELVAQIAEAVQHAHERGVIHRDLKPGNILMDQEGRPHVADFGLAKRETGEITMTLDGQILGTPAYMSPEQARGKAHEATAASDVYSLGVILFELLTGELPFRGEKRMLILQILNDEPPSPRKLRSRVPRDLETICLKAMGKEPLRRYGTAQDFATDLRRYLAGETILARPVGHMERAWRWCRRNAAVAGLIGAVIVALTAGTLVSTLFAVQAVAEKTRAEGEKTRADKKAAEALAEKGRADSKAAEALAEKGRADNKAAEALAEKGRAEEQLNRAEQLLYATQLASAQREWENNNAAGAWQYLRAARGDFRGWERDYLHTLFTKNNTTLQGHASGVTSVAFSPDGKRIVSGCWDNSIKVWDATTGQETLALQGHTGSVTSVAFSPDGKWIVSGSVDKTLKVWDATTGQESLTFKGHIGSVDSVAFSLDGTQIVSGSSDMTLKVWDATSGQETRTLLGHSNAVTSVAFSPDGQRIVSGSTDMKLRVWDATASGQKTLTLLGHTGEVRSVAFSPDGKRIVSGSDDLSGSYDDTLKVWDATTGQETLTFKGHTSWVNSVAFSPDGQRIVSGNRDKTLKVWDATTGQETLMLKGHTGEVRSVAFSPDGQRIVSGGDDKTLKVWDATVQETLTLLGHASWVNSVAFSPDGKRIVSGSTDMELRVWDATTGQETLRHGYTANVVTSVAFSPDGKRIVSGQHTPPRSGINRMAQFMLQGSESNALKVWDATASGQKTLTLLGHTGGVKSVAFSPDGQQIVSGGDDLSDSYDGVLKVWDATTGQETLSLQGHTGTVTSVAFSPDGQRIVSGSYDNMLKLWDAKTGQETLTLQGHIRTVTSVAFSPDGQRIVSGSDDKTLKLWDAKTGQETLTLQGHIRTVTSVAFSPDGQRIVSGSDDKTLKLWDAKTGQETLTLQGHAGEVTSVAFSPDGKRIVSGSRDNTLKVWDATRSMPIESPAPKP